MSPAGTGRHAHPLSRGHSRFKPRISPAARAIAERDPIGSLRRSARSLDSHRLAQRAGRATIRPASIRWSMRRRALRDPRTFRAVLEPR